MCEESTYQDICQENFNNYKLFVIPVSFTLSDGSKRWIQLLIDTGSEITILTESASSILNLETNGDDITGYGTGGSQSYRPVVGPEMHIGDKISKNTNFFVGPLPKPFGKRKILGIIGSSTLQEFCLKLDYPNGTLELL